MTNKNLIDNVKGQRFGRLVVLKEAGRSKQNTAMWLCKCDCNATTIVRCYDVLKGITQSCGCLNKEMTSKAKRIDLTKKVFGRLTVVRCAGTNKRGHLLWECICNCGEHTTVLGASLRNGQTKSCGCLSKEGFTNLTHGHTIGGHFTPEYQSWKGMRERCTNPKSSGYPNYGGRGIKICKRWAHSFENFFKDMGPRPKGKTLDRKNNDKGYKPSNCRWATRSEQNKNQRRLLEAA